MYAVLAEESLTRLFSNTESTMASKDSPYLHAHNLISNDIANEAIFLSDHKLSKCFMRLQSEKAMGWCTAQCKNNAARVMQFELACLKTTRKNTLAVWQLSS